MRLTCEFELSYFLWNWALLLMSDRILFLEEYLGECGMRRSSISTTVNFRF